MTKNKYIDGTPKGPEFKEEMRVLKRVYPDFGPVKLIDQFARIHPSVKLEDDQKERMRCCVGRDLVKFAQGLTTEHLNIGNTPGNKIRSDTFDKKIVKYLRRKRSSIPKASKKFEVSCSTIQRIIADKDLKFFHK